MENDNTIRMNIQLPHFQGFYGTYYDTDFIDNLIDEDIRYYKDECNIDVDYDDFDVDYKYRQKAIATHFCEVLMDEYVPCYVKAIENPEIDSPKYYNFRNDRIYADVTFSEDYKEQMLKFIADNQEQLTKDIKRDWTSRDGFMSFMSNNITDWIEEFHKDTPDERYVSCLLGYQMEYEHQEPGTPLDATIALHVLEDIDEYEFITCKKDLSENEED